MLEKRLTTIGSFPTAAEAHAARLLLASQGIAAVVVDEALVGNFWYLGNAVGGIKLQVDAADDLRARQLLAEEQLQPVGDSDPVKSTTWKCSQCRERVPENFDVCWSCGAARGPDDAEDAQTENIEPPLPKPAVAETPAIRVRESICPKCGMLLSASGDCPLCGHAATINPYDAPLHPGLAESKPAPGALREQRLAADALAQRAWRAACFGVLFPPLCFYSIFLLVVLAERHSRLSPRMYRRITWAWAISLLVLVSIGVFFLGLTAFR